MELQQREADSVQIIDISGDLDLYNSGKLKETINKLVASNIRGLILNFEKVDYIDSSGVGVLIYSNSLLKSNKTPFRIIQVHGSVRRVIELTKLIGFLPIVDTEQTALAQIKAGG